MFCVACNRKLRADNKLGHCRKHRHLAQSTKERLKRYEEKNKEKVKQTKLKSAKKNYWKTKLRYENDIQFWLRCALRNRLNSALKRNAKKHTKSCSHISDLGCTTQELKNYLESKFKPGMTWENRGRTGWHIDHIIPLSSFDLSNREEALKACHYTNLQPLWAEENLAKNAKIISLHECPKA